MKPCLAAAVLALILPVCFAAAPAGKGYPSSYPSDKIFDALPKLPTTAPSYTYDDKDVGNYAGLVYHADTWYGDESKGWFPTIWHFANTGTNMYFVKFYVGRPSPISNIPLGFNCTQKGLGKFSSDKVLASGALEKSCTGACCDAYVGHDMFSADYEEYSKGFEGRVTSGACPTPNEAEFCVNVMLSMKNCMEYYISPSERKFVLPCFSLTTAYLMNCKVFKLSGVIKWIDRYEPPKRLAELSAADSIMIYALKEQPDRVCQPYSYYYPDDKPPSSSEPPSSSAVSHLMFFSFFVSCVGAV